MIQASFLRFYIVSESNIITDHSAVSVIAVFQWALEVRCFLFLN